VRDAYAQLGKPYVYGGTGPGGFDCSGLAQHAWRAAGVSIPRTSQQQAAVGQAVGIRQMLPGDLLFYYPGLSHVAIYVGSEQIIYAPHTGDFVRLGTVRSMPLVSVRRP
jgi:cell wall-associated NlpC family hydrolase